jgi:hypothetical protein
MIKIRQFLGALAFVGVALVASNSSAQTISVHPGTSGCTGSAGLNIPTGGGTADFHVCVNAPANRTCGAGFFLSASSGTAGMSISARTIGTTYSDPLQSNGTFLNGTNNLLDPDTSNAGSLIADSTSFVAAGSGILVASFTLTVPSTTPAGVYQVGTSAPIVNLTADTCDGATSDSSGLVASTLSVTKAGVVATPSVTIAALPTTLVDAAANVSTITVTSSAPAAAGGLVVNLTPAAVNARYTTTCGATITITAGATTATCTVTATANTTPGDGSATATTALAAPSASYTLGATTSAAVTINDDDVAALPTVTVTGSAACAEPATNCAFTVTASAAVTGASFTLGGTASPNGVDYRIRQSTCAGAELATALGNFTANLVAGANNIAVCIVDDATAEPTETVILTVNTNAAATAGSPASATVNMTDNDGPPTVSIAVLPASVADNGTNLVYTVSRTGPTTAALAVTLTTTPTGTMTGQSVGGTTCGTTLSIPIGQASATCTYSATNTVPADGPLSVAVAIQTNAAYTVATAPGNAATGTITNDDVAPTASVAAGAATITEGNTATFTLSCTGPATVFAIPYTVNTIAGDGVPTPASPANLTCGTPLNITVTTQDNAVQGDTRALTLTLGALPAGLTLGGTGAASVTVQDNDAPLTTPAVPTLGTLGIALMGLLIAGFGALTQRRRK